ncbi:MAG: hypothetical protein ACR2IH_01740 [Pyrinomonadaceae bacterium]
MSEHLISFEDAASDPLACAAYIAEAIRSGDGRASAMEAVVPHYLHRGDVDLAAELANTVDDPYTRDRLLIKVAEKCAEIDDVDYAVQLAESVDDRGLRLQALESIGLRCASRSEFDRARVLAAELDHPEFVLANIAAYLNAAGDEAASETTLSEIDFPSARVAAFQEIAAAATAKSDAERAVAFTERALESAGEIEHEEEKIRVLCEIGISFVELKRNDRAVETFAAARGVAEALDNIHRDPLLALVANGFLQASSSEFADRTLDLITDKASLASGLLGFARDSARRGENDEGIETLEEAYAILRSQKERETRDAKAKINLHAQIAGQFAGFGKGERGIEIAHEIADDGGQVSALSQIARASVLRGEPDAARMAIRAIHDDDNRVFALLGMSDAFNEIGEADCAIAALNEASELAETVPQLSSRAEAYSEIGARFGGGGDEASAGRVIETSLDTILMIRDESNRAAALAGVSAVLDAKNLNLSDRGKEILVKIVSAAG